MPLLAFRFFLMWAFFRRLPVCFCVEVDMGDENEKAGKEGGGDTHEDHRLRGCGDEGVVSHPTRPFDSQRALFSTACHPYCAPRIVLSGCPPSLPPKAVSRIATSRTRAMALLSTRVAIPFFARPFRPLRVGSGQCCGCVVVSAGALVFCSPSGHGIGGIAPRLPPGRSAV